MRTRVVGIVMAVLLVGIFFGEIAHADDIKARMIERLPVIKVLKVKGMVGENNQGYLEFLGSGKDQEDVVNAENADRGRVYKAIAKQQGTTPEVVGRRRALQIAEKATSGEWIQNESGKWIRTP